MISQRQFHLHSNEGPQLFANGWISHVAIGTFKIDEGQSIDALYPLNSLTQEERKAIQMISFPDTQCFGSGNDLMIEYCFRIKIGGQFHLGFVLFIRKKDINTDRGYIQKSLIIISKLPLINFFQNLLSVISDHFYEQICSSEDLLKKAMKDFEKWPFPSSQKVFDLVLLGKHLQVKVPQSALKYQQNLFKEKAIRENHFSQNTQAVYGQSLTNEPELQKGLKKYASITLGDEETQIQKFGENSKLQKSSSLWDVGIMKVFQRSSSSKNKDLQMSSTIKNTSAFQKNSEIQQFQFLQGKSSEQQNEQDLPELCEIKKSRSNSQEKKSTSSISAANGKGQKATLSDILKETEIQQEGLFQEINIFRQVQFDKLHVLWPVWEMVLLNQPFLVTANSPSECSAAVLGFISLISPLEFSGDYRPYFTVYDPEYNKVNSEYDKCLLGNYILGTCNPLFQLIFKLFPAIIGFDTKSVQTQQLESTKSKKPLNCLKLNKTKIDIIPDQKSLEKLLLQSNSAEALAINNSLVRKHFRAMTLSFLEPIEEYLKIQNERKVFEEKSFIAYLKKQKKFSISPFYKEKAVILALYQKFLRSANFLKYIRSIPNVEYMFPLFSPLNY